ncbi:type II toxin-antitoxin system VapC family toxin [Methylococcus sp. Mc7]|uniref:type II toxin-antitoxin system VapC family toxin n=1 Tax=Methylococcus sp. Mc7 TaxID=2860258 RepID=UPI001C52D2F4|nr:type II toxin-antitoxin system VapC family toxin [Methylococcus sp. Mc7]QXP84560.1 type II toxin-antitoxin system VapC family toxin [Methylococcus sp. Mc7]
MAGLYVVDASVLLKWVLPPDHEPWQDEAWSIFVAARQGKIEPAAPSLWGYEVGNILSRKFPDQAAESLASLTAILGEGHSVADSAFRAVILELLARNRVTFYDAAYHALAIVREGVFVTADEKYLNAVGSESHIMHLKDWR